MGQIITFYSYKGGTGRSMALANIAWTLASNGHRVLMIDWDLEAPGLHRYFRPFLKDKDLLSIQSYGLIDFVLNYSVQRAAADPAPFDQLTDIRAWSVPLCWPDSSPVTFGNGEIRLVPAGRHDDGYGDRVNAFDWRVFYERLEGGAFLEAVKERTKKEFDYVLIDSRTGISDTSGICTVQMPDSLVICYTYNLQSIEGARRIATKVRQKRPNLPITAVPMRVEFQEEARLATMRSLAWERFAEFVPRGSERDSYFGELEIPYYTRYAYAERLAAFDDQPGAKGSIQPEIEHLASLITGSRVQAGLPPEQWREPVLREFLLDGPNPVEPAPTPRPLDAENYLRGRRVFISCARTDGLDTALRLRLLLCGLGVEVWFEVESVPLRAPWSASIEQALNDCDVLLAVLSPGAYVSETCRAEHIWALDKGKAVIPVLAVAGAPVPIYFKMRQYRKYPDQEAELLADIAAIAAEVPVPRPLRYDTVPTLPPNYVVRENALVGLRDLVFTEGEGANVVAVAGMGGIGKTVLAASLCRDVAVQRAFPDGIAWITIGREWDGDFVTRMREVARALGDDLGGYDNRLACENRYRTILREKAALVVVDDVWNLSDLQPLLVDAARSRFLFTTRDGGIAKAVTDRKYLANLLSDGEARDLLARWAGIAVEALPREAEQIILECGDLALAVAQVGSSLRDLPPDEWRDTLGALERADITGIEERLPAGQKSFFRSLAVSVDALPAPMQERYRKLAVLLEEVSAPLAVLRTLWKVNEAEARRTARYFVDRSLSTWKQPSEPASGIRLHDLQLDYVRARFEDQAALRLIHGAMRLSANAIARRPEEFASQMVGRLLPHEGIGAVAEFAKDVAQGAPRPWLRPMRPCLHPPGTSLIRTLEGHSASVNGVAVTAGGRHVVSASEDFTLKVWDLESGQALRTLTGHSASVNGVAVTADGRRAVSVSSDRTLKVWDLEGGQELRTLTGHLGRVNSAAVTADGRRTVSASNDNTLKVWDLETAQELRTLTGHLDRVNGVAVTADGRRAVSASWDNTLKVWDLETGQELRTLAGHSNWVNGVAVTPDGRLAISASEDRTLKVWDLESGQALRTLVGHSAYVYGVAVTPDGQRAVSASNDHTLKVWDLESGQELRTLAGHSSFVYGVAVTADGRGAVSASYDKTVKVWDLLSGRALQAGHSDCVSGMAVATDGQRAETASWDGTLKVWELESGQMLRTLAGHSDVVSAVAVTADGRHALSASYDKMLKVWDPESGQELRTLAGHSNWVNGVAVTADGRRVVSASYDKTLKVWNLESGRELRTLAGHSDWVNSVAVTPDGRCAVSASSDNTLKVWDLESGQELRTLEGHSGGVCSVAVTADGRRAVSASQDGTLKVWDLGTGRELRSLAGHSDSVNGVAVTADGRRAISASWDNTLKVWDLDSETVIAEFTCDGAAECCIFVGPDKIFAGDRGGRLYWLKLET